MASHMAEASFFVGVCERTVERYISNFLVNGHVKPGPVGRSHDSRELKQPRRRRQQKPHKFAYLTTEGKTVFLHALHVHFSSFDILKTFSFFLRREMTCFAVEWTT